MKTIFSTILACTLAAAVHAEEKLTPEMQQTLDAQKVVIAKWAANRVIVDAVIAQNAKGPIPGMSNAKWKTLKTNDQIVQAFLNNPAGKWLAQKLQESDGFFTEAFLNAQNGEKVAFAAKPTSYLHAGTSKFDVAIKNKTWQGKPEFDESAKTDEIQISTPVIYGNDPIGVLVVGVSMKKLEGK